MISFSSYNTTIAWNMVSHNDDPDGTEPEDHDELVDDHEVSNLSDEDDGTESDDQVSYINDEDDLLTSLNEFEISRSAPSTSIPTTPNADFATDTAGEPQRSGMKSNKRSPNTADLPQGNESSKKTSQRKPYRSIRKSENINDPSEKLAKRLAMLQNIFPRKGLAGSHKIRIVCRGGKCPRQFLVNDWGEPRRHYLKTDADGNAWHPDTPFDKHQFKYMSDSNAKKRARRIKNGEGADHDSESESDVSDQDYRGFNSVPNRPGADPKKVGKRTISRKGKEKADNSSGKGPAAGKGATKSGKQPERSGDEDAIEKHRPNPNDCSKRCVLLQQALDKATLDLVRLGDQMERERQDRRDELRRLGHEAAAFAQDPVSAPNPLSYNLVVVSLEMLLEETKLMNAQDMILNVPSRGNDAQSLGHVLGELVVPTMTADFQNLPEMPQQTQDPFILPNTEPLRFSTSADSNANVAAISPFGSNPSIDPNLQPPHQQNAAAPTTRQDGLSNYEAQRRLIELVQVNSSDHGRQPTQEEADEVLFDADGNADEAVDLIRRHWEPERGWGPPAED